MKVIILAGGLGTRLSEYTKIIPKPMIKINKIPIIERIMQHYSSFGYHDFIIALGYKNLRWKKINKEQFKESKLLNLNCSKIKKMTNWEPKLNFHQTMHKTIEWYNLYNMGQNITNQQIKEYFNEK